MPTINYNFAASNSSVQAGSPLTIIFQPSGINVGTGYISKIIYEFPDKTITRNYTFASNADALTGIYKDFDPRSPVAYTFPGENVDSSSTTVSSVTITVTIAPSFSSTVYTLSANLILQYLTQNPTGSSAPYAFDEFHLLKTRVWGATNSQLYIFETKNPTYLIINSTGGQGGTYISTPTVGAEYLVTDTEDPIVTDEDIPIEVA